MFDNLIPLLAQVDWTIVGVAALSTVACMALTEGAFRAFRAIDHKLHHGA